MTYRVGIAGAGLAGRLTALACLARGWQVSLFEAGPITAEGSCGYTAAGMLAPFTELESSEWIICRLGLLSLELWPKILAKLSADSAFKKQGSMVLAHPQDKGDLDRWYSILKFKLAKTHNINHLIQTLDKAAINEKIPGIASSLQGGYWLAEEGQVDSQQFFKAAGQYFLQESVQCYDYAPVLRLSPGLIETKVAEFRFDLVIDCRGMGMKSDIQKLRGVRGELIHLQSDEVDLACPVRIMHPRYPIYIVPRENQQFIVGATSIESEDYSPISAQSMLELLSACYTVHPQFAEARIIKTASQCRPAFADHLPKIYSEDGLLRINGLYRHGYLIGPAVIQDALNAAEKGQQAMFFPELLQQTKEECLV